MPELFTPYTLKGVTLRNRIAMSPMTMYRSVDGKLNDYHLMYLGARGRWLGLIFPEQIAISPRGQDQPALRGHRRRRPDRGPAPKPREGGTQIAPDDPMGWQIVGPMVIPSRSCPRTGAGG